MIPYSRQQITRQDIHAIAQVLRSKYLTTGPAVEAFETALCKLTGARYAIACSNGTTALHLACLAIGLGKGHIGITSPLTFLASANCIEYCGAKTAFVDIDLATLCLSPAKLDEYCKTRKVPKVVIPVDYAGIPADLPAIHALAKKYGFMVIEDAAHSIGSTYSYHGKTYQCGSCAHTDIATFSFHPVKNITTGEGGAVLTNNARLAAKLRLLRSHGMTKDPALLSRKDGPWYYEMVDLGFNYRITDIQCALGISQLKRLGKIKKQRQAIVREYNRIFTGIEGIVTPPWPKHASPCQHLYPIWFANGSRARMAAYNTLAENGIHAQVHYIPVYMQPYYVEKYGKQAGLCQNAERFYNACLSLPLYPELTKPQIKKIVELVVEVVV
ncbi:MAG: UDP-4-amino-4,6-dideoxy-N-acetyl-beta-L-altrosamine transaminase [Candidatus Raymondbacteria bacterium RifOxyA12_full_50_37]|uniref:UDP-4-amino-4, 6-dideoxy-N-acetyl-beta-L-altrosamine transaminase n=1 Tax=Candidatus Raymondbacteria bacterium RIFOXYD12_FULL_49_13 TaxID=1817890 RepID=A0A1F7F713_UNCRA|nr:MAG: UDP-4-amino-4,6-dideoxy-N-acetyl-beta-L-altrosamine transaminase [Candidatus Raymondbacteria bacterium RifOxyA12_full_50_37]OGJ88478.1 MAG: UDP-4-amino-4,6-dideoxy-N-acetyl-beta-L-altrosamine transaminase [Candidatus Raymondbacteria bacterium RIFOXYA2_FULL_49_16]OGJ98938.1 MAG: UDP-4-amino-4,6-dideoxy-N-acetyl-beta-L-altrosamine transaminase [Candidatus Raymondbacteria bacterium RIFOXYC2_FULL_50_21]OGK02362.1 MAG: UDP-4-amino-4,6-dideoxy-N-acetyl-beta-L-altrosamine transaminase [Candidat